MQEYAPSLYQKRNIIGYTGDIDNNPSVYFKNANQYGHITQAHPVEGFKGRETGSTSSSYLMSNSGPKGVLQESIDGLLFHQSRTALKQTSNLIDLEKLATAIERFPYLKPHNFQQYNEVTNSLEAGIGSINPVVQSLIQFEFDLRQAI